MATVPAVNAQPISVVRVQQDTLEGAAARLVARASGNRAGAGKDFLAAARRHGIDLTNFWASRGPDTQSGKEGAAIRQVCLVTPGAGQTAMLFTSTPGAPAEVEELGRVVRAAMDAAGDRLGQALLEPEETTIAGALEHAGFVRLAELAYMRATLPSQSGRAQTPIALELPGGVTATTWKPSDDPDLLLALERSYIDTLDCPELCALRTTKETLDSHKATGGPEALDPAYWWVIREGGRPEGAMLFSASPALGHVELVYLGLSPGLRGRGVATRLLVYGLEMLARRKGPERLVTCAIDVRNLPARRLYERHGFAEFSRRIAMVYRRVAPHGPTKA